MLLAWTGCAGGREDQKPLGVEFKQQEQKYLTRWQEIVHRYLGLLRLAGHQTQSLYQFSLVEPNLLTGASPVAPTEVSIFIRRITFRKNDPVALACIDYGYNVALSVRQR